jgi:thiol-disulfide isomerase/thioredoxin
MNINLILKVILALTVVGGGVLVFQNLSNDKMIDDEKMMKDSSNVKIQKENGDDMEKKESEKVIDDVVMKKEDLNSNKGRYIKLSELDMNNISGITILDFYAPWCPSCVVLKKDILSKLDEIPESVTLVEVDYDTEKDLAKKYGVKYQHILVQIDENANEITKWSGSLTLESLVNNIK